MPKQSLLTNQQIEAFILRHRLPAKFRNLIDEHYLCLVSWVMQKRVANQVLFIGINGAQGTGKSTLAAFLRFALKFGAGWRVAVLSIDDFYLTKWERERLAAHIHPLLKTRGVPGTHDLKLLSTCLADLRSLAACTDLQLPCFDKARDDRVVAEAWPVISGPIDVIILEGWCVGSAPQQGDELRQAINPLEEQQDASGEWRRFVNDQLAGDYAELFAQLDALVFLQAPDFDAVYRWRLEQEEKLAAVTADNGADIMNKEQIAGFIQHYERITRANFVALPKTADVVLELDTDHDCVQVHYATAFN